jgi:FkbM family methyltransferase
VTQGRRGLAGRLELVVKRALRARALGFNFGGTSRSLPPTRAWLTGRWCDIQYPTDQGYLSDVINVWLDDEYGLRRLEADPPQIVVDIGANIGLFSMWARHCFPQARLLAYEPNPRIYPCLERNVRSMGVQTHKCGVADAAGRATMQDASDSRLASTHRSADGEITLVSLTDVVAAAGGTIDLLKLDCEGAEWDILRAVDAVDQVKSIHMEYHLVNGHTVEDLVAVTKQLGFEVRHLIPNSAWGIAWLDRMPGAPGTASAEYARGNRLIRQG